MTPTAVAIRESIAADRAAVRVLLATAGLPTADLESAPGLRFWVADEGGRVVAAVAIEQDGAAALLRSLVVAPSHRDRGLGRALVNTAEKAARAEGIELLVLLTTTAERFFHHLGYSVTDRGYLPDEVKQSAEFRSLCPSSAVCMTKSLVSPIAGASNA